MRILALALLGSSLAACGSDSHPAALDSSSESGEGGSGEERGTSAGNASHGAEPATAGAGSAGDASADSTSSGEAGNNGRAGGGAIGGSAGASNGGSGGSAGGPGATSCGAAVCSTGQVCCGAPYPCQDMCVPDCRLGGACPNQLECSATTGVCVPPATGGGGAGGMGTGGAMGGMAGIGGAMGGMAGIGGAMGGMAGVGGAMGGTGGKASGGASGAGGTTLGDPAECDGELGSIDTPGPSTPAAGDPYANFNVSLNACNVTSAALECQSQVLVQHYLSETISSTKRSYRSNVIPDHEVGTFPKPGQNPHYIEPQNVTYSMPLTPSGSGEELQVVFGLATSGVVFEPQTAEYYNDSGYLYEALRFASVGSYDATDDNNHPGALGLDCNFAHVQSAGKYHYHGVPHAMLSDAPALTFLGWAADGYPIFGVWGPLDPDDLGSSLVEMRSSYRIKSGARPEQDAPPGDYDGTFVQDWEYVADPQDPDHGDLDECNGRTGQIVVPGVNGGAPFASYHYFITHTFPYIPRCFHATPDPSFDPKVSPK